MLTDGLDNLGPPTGVAHVPAKSPGVGFGLASPIASEFKLRLGPLFILDDLPEVGVAGSGRSGSTAEQLGLGRGSNQQWTLTGQKTVSIPVLNTPETPFHRPGPSSTATVCCPAKRTGQLCTSPPSTTTAVCCAPPVLQ